jgi:hypothetical protein
MAGFGYAAKYTAVLGLPYALGFLAWKLRRDRTAMVSAAAVVSGCALLMMAPWLAKNWLWVHNPLAPFFNAWFPNRYVTIGFEREYLEYLRHYDLTSLRQIPSQITIGGRLSGIFGPVFLLMPLALAALRRPAGRRLWLAALVFGIPFLRNIGTRFLIPAAPFLAVAFAMAVLSWGRAGRYLATGLVVAHALLSWPDVLNLYAGPYTWRLRKVAHREALRIKPEEGYLLSNLPGYGMARLLERVVPAGTPVLALNPLPEAYTNRDVLVGYQSASNRVLQDILWTPLVPGSAPTRLLRFRFAPQNLQAIRVVQTGRHQSEYWSVTELRMFHDGRERPRASDWRLRAHPNPWYVQMAFDNSLVTRWSSQQGLFPGMFLQADFGGGLMVDAVEITCSRDQRHVRLRLEGQDAEGQWKTLAASPGESELEPLFGLRRAAIEELKARGIGYLVVMATDLFADDFFSHPSLWGFRQVGEVSGYRLYEL